MRILISPLSLVLLVTIYAAPTSAAPADDARKYLIRGTAAIESARSPADLEDAAREFRKATEVAPEMAAAWYNLGSVQAKQGKYQEAIASYRRYLQLAPAAEDAQRIDDEIVKLEYQLEKTRRVQARSGVWRDDTLNKSTYKVTAEGDKLLITGNHRRSQENFEYHDTIIGLDAGPPNFLFFEELTFRLTVQGDKLSGTWEMPSAKIYKTDPCILPAEQGVVEGELDETAGRMVLRLKRNKYKVVEVTPPIFGSKYCEEVSAIGTVQEQIVLTRQ